MTLIYSDNYLTRPKKIIFGNKNKVPKVIKFRAELTLLDLGVLFGAPWACVRVRKSISLIHKVLLQIVLYKIYNFSVAFSQMYRSFSKNLKKSFWGFWFRFKNFNFPDRAGQLDHTLYTIFIKLLSSKNGHA